MIIFFLRPISFFASHIDDISQARKSEGEFRGTSITVKYSGNQSNLISSLLQFFYM